MQIKARNPIARTLRDGSLRAKVVRAKKGKGSYNRRKWKGGAA